MQTPPLSHDRSRGSVLVGVLIFSVILAIAGASTLLLANHSSSQGSLFVDEDRYLRTAENALTLVLAKINNRSAWPIGTDFNNVQIGNPANNVGGHPVLNGLPVQVTLVIIGGDYLVTSRVFVEANANNPVRFTKTITCRVVRAGATPPEYKLSFLFWNESNTTVTYP